jgi:hypothetical protein
MNSDNIPIYNNNIKNYLNQEIINTSKLDYINNNINNKIINKLITTNNDNFPTIDINTYNTDIIINIINLFSQSINLMNFMKNGLDKYDSNYNISSNIELNSYINNRNIISDNNISIPDNDYVWIFRLSETEIDLLNNSVQIINLDCIHISKFIKKYGNITKSISKENNLLLQNNAIRIYLNYFNKYINSNNISNKIYFNFIKINWFSLTEDYDLTSSKYNAVYYYYHNNYYYFIGSGVNINYFMNNTKISLLENTIQYTNILIDTMDNFLLETSTKYNELFNYILNFYYSTFNNNDDFISVNNDLNNIINTTDTNLLYIQIYLVSLDKNNNTLDYSNIDNISIAYDYTDYNKYINTNNPNNINWIDITKTKSLENGITYTDKYKYIYNQIITLLPDTNNNFIYLYDKINTKNNIVIGKKYYNSDDYINYMILVCISIDDIIPNKIVNISDTLIYGNFKICDSNNNSILSVNSNDNTISIKKKLGINTLNPSGLLDVNTIDVNIIYLLTTKFNNKVAYINTFYYDNIMNSNIFDISLLLDYNYNLFSCDYRYIKKDFDLTRIFCCPITFQNKNLYGKYKDNLYIDLWTPDTPITISSYNNEQKWIYDFFTNIVSSYEFINNLFNTYTDRNEFSQLIICDGDNGPKICYILIFKNKNYTSISTEPKYFCLFDGVDIYDHINNSIFIDDIIKLYETISKSLNLVLITDILLLNKLNISDNLNKIKNNDYSNIIYDYDNDFKKYIDNTIYYNRFGDNYLRTYAYNYIINDNNKFLYNETNKFYNGKLTKNINIGSYNLLSILNDINNNTNILLSSFSYYIYDNIFIIVVLKKISLIIDNENYEFIIACDVNVNNNIDNIKLNGHLMTKGNISFMDYNNNNLFLLDTLNSNIKINTNIGFNNNNPKSYIDINNINLNDITTIINNISYIYRKINDLTSINTYGIFNINVSYELQNYITKYNILILNNLKYKNLNSILSNSLYKKIADNIEIDDQHNTNWGYVNVSELSKNINDYINNYIDINTKNNFSNKEDEYIILLCRGYLNTINNNLYQFYFIYNSIKHELDGYSINNMLASNNFDLSLSEFYRNLFNNINTHFIDKFIQIFYLVYNSQYYLIISKILIINGIVFQLLYIVNLIKYINTNNNIILLLNNIETLPLLLQLSEYNITDSNIENNYKLFYNNINNKTLKLSVFSLDYNKIKNYIINNKIDIFSKDNLLTFIDFLIKEVNINHYYDSNNNNFNLNNYNNINELLYEYINILLNNGTSILNTNISLDNLSKLEFNQFRYILYQIVFVYNIYDLQNNIIGTLYYKSFENNNDSLLFFNTKIIEDKLIFFTIEYDLTLLIQPAINIIGNQNISGTLNISNFLKIDGFNKIFSINSLNSETDYLFGYKTIKNINPMSGLILQNAIISNNYYPNLVVERITETIDNNILDKSGLINTRSALSIRRTSQTLLMNNIIDNSNSKYGIDCAFEVQDTNNITYEIGNIGFVINGNHDNNNPIIYPKADFVINNCHINNETVIQEEIFKVSNDGDVELPKVNSSIIFNINSNTKYELNIIEDNNGNPIFNINKIKNNINVNRYQFPLENFKII